MKEGHVSILQPSYVLLQEIFEINGRLVETVVSICNEDVCPSEDPSGLTVVTCSYVPVALSAAFKALYSSGRIVSLSLNLYFYQCLDSAAYVSHV